MFLWLQMSRGPGNLIFLTRASVASTVTLSISKFFCGVNVMAIVRLVERFSWHTSESPEHPSNENEFIFTPVPPHDFHDEQLARSELKTTNVTRRTLMLLAFWIIDTVEMEKMSKWIWRNSLPLFNYLHFQQHVLATCFAQFPAWICSNNLTDLFFHTYCMILFTTSCAFNQIIKVKSTDCVVHSIECVLLILWTVVYYLWLKAWPIRSRGCVALSAVES